MFVIKLSYSFLKLYFHIFFPKINNNISPFFHFQSRSSSSSNYSSGSNHPTQIFPPSTVKASARTSKARPASTSTPSSRRSAPDLSSPLGGFGGLNETTTTNLNYATPGSTHQGHAHYIGGEGQQGSSFQGRRLNFSNGKSPRILDNNESRGFHELSAELDLSDQQQPQLPTTAGRQQQLAATAGSSSLEDYGLATPLEDSHEDTPMFTPRANTRVVRIISKQSNVWLSHPILWRAVNWRKKAKTKDFF